MNLFRLTFVLFTALACLPSAVAAQVPTAAPISGVVLDGSGAAVPGATVVLAPRAGAPSAVVTDAEGRFAFTPPTGPAALTVTADGFEPLVVTPGAGPLRLMLRPSAVHERVTVEGRSGQAPVITSGMKAPTPLRDVPQAVTVLTGQQLRDLSVQGISDVMRYVPGAGVAQGESNRDAPVLRGTTTTGDFFLDGVRDDAQYFRDLYNVERVEVLKGPNAMIFGRGGVGGVVNRVSKQAEWTRISDLSLQAGSWSNRRVTADVGDALGRAAAVRVAGVFEDSGSYRSGVSLERQGITPSLALALSERTMLQASAEYFHDRRTADRGVPSLNGRPLDTAPDTFFGNADLSYAEATVNNVGVTLVHAFRGGVELRNQVRVATYDKFYQNVYPGAVNESAGTVALSAYHHGTDRTNLFDQLDLLVPVRTGRVSHRLALGTELGRQASGNLRHTGYFGGMTTSTAVPLASPTTSLPVTFAPSASDADLDSVATIGAAYLQDQVELGRHVEVIAGLRLDRFEVEATNHRTGSVLRTEDNLLSPRVGVVVRPAAALSLYSSYSLSYQPRAGEQLTSLSLTTASLEPETFRNVEAGAKWDAGGVSATAAVYRLRRGNVAIASPTDPTAMLLVDGQQIQGLELGLSGRVTRSWQLLGAYAYQDGRITTTQSATIREGARLGQVPAHAWSLWNRYDVAPVLGGGLGIVHRDAMFVNADNTVRLPAFTRLDAAMFVAPAARVRLQINVENLLDTRYYASAHNNNNITPGSPRALRVTVATGF